MIDPDVNLSEQLPTAIDLCINVDSTVAPDVIAGQLSITMFGITLIYGLTIGLQLHQRLVKGKG